MKTAAKPALALIGRLWFPAYFFIVLAIDFAFRYLYFTDNSVSVFSPTPLLFSACWALLLCGMLYALPSGVRKVFIVGLTLIFSVLCITNAVMYNLFGSFFSFADLSYAGVGAQFFSFSYIVVRGLLLVCLALAIIGSVIIAVAIPKRSYHPARLIVSAGLIAAAVISIFCLDSYLEGHTSQELTWDNTAVSIADADAYHTLSNTNRALSVSGIYQFACRSAVSALGLDAKDEKVTWDSLDEYYASSKKLDHPDNEMTGIFKGKNLIMVAMESIDTWMLTEEYMPNLYSLEQNGFNFTNHFTPLYISAGTFCTEFIANTGVIPPSTGIDVSVYEANSFPFSLAHRFNEAGYCSNFFHSASPTIYNRGNVHRNLGFASYYSHDDMGMENYIMDSQLINGYELMTADSPFFSFVLTISAHGSYIDDAWIDAATPHMDAARAAVDTDSLPDSCTNTEEYIRAIAQAMETDKFIGELLDHLDEDGLMDDTVLVLFADHYGKYITNHSFLMDLKGADNTDMLCNTPLIIYSKDTGALTIDKVSSTADIAPTIANLFSLETNYSYYAGNDVFGDGGGYVVFTGNNWYDGDIYYSASYTGEKTAYIFDMNKKIERDMSASWDTLRSDYFSHLGG